MNKIVTLTGHKNCGKVDLAYKLSRNSDVGYIKPFTDKPLVDGDYHYVSKTTLDILIEEEEVLSETVIDGNRYVFFESQLTHPYNIMILDDYGVADLQKKYKNLYTVKVYGKDQIDSDRVGVYLYDDEFNEVFHYGESDIDELEVNIA